MGVAGFAWLLAFWFVGEGIVRLLQLPLPGNVVGLLGLFIALQLKWVKLEWLEHTAQFLLSHMMLFFVPIIVGTMVFYPYLLNEWLPISVMLIVGTLFTLAATGVTAKRFESSSKGARQHDE